MAEEYAEPVRPLLNSDAQIVWVHGLRVDEVEIFRIDDVFAWERKNRRWSYALFACALFAVAYFGVKWHRGNGPTNRSTRHEQAAGFKINRANPTPMCATRGY